MDPVIPATSCSTVLRPRLKIHPREVTLLRPTQFRDVVRGRQRSWWAGPLRAVLGMLEWPYRGIVRWRNRRYDAGRAASYAVPVPVICVGNLTLGGTGKTPLVEWLAGWLSRQGIRVTIVSRGYGAASGELNDEARELQLALPEVAHVQNPDRVAGAKAAIARHHAEVILLDDGFQHRRLQRDVDVVLLDATEPWGFEHVFPRGTLREPLAGLARAHAVVLSRAQALDRESRQAIRQRVAQLAPTAVWCEVAYPPRALITWAGDRRPLAQLAGQRVAAFCGIGNPAGFQQTLQQVGCEVVGWQEFPDHHRYTPRQIDDLAKWALAYETVLCTRKDLVKLQRNRLGSTPLYALAMEAEFLTGESELLARLQRALAVKEMNAS